MVLEFDWMTKSSKAVALPAALVAVIMMLGVPTSADVGVPEMTPVVASMLSPLGSPVAEKVAGPLSTMVM